MSLPAIRTISDLAIKKRLRCHAGAILMKLVPARTRAVRANLFDPNLGGIDKLIRNGLFYQALRRNDHAKLKEFLVHYWASDEGKAFHDEFQFRFETHFLDHAVRATDDFAAHLDAAKPAIDKIYEIGCGTGQVLEYLAGRFPAFKRFVGIDLSRDQIEENQGKFKAQAQMEFAAADACEWMPANAEAGCLVLTNGGVLEYLHQSELERLLATVANELAPASLVIVETVANDHDLDSELESLVYGREMSFSHNYPYLIERAGLSIRYREERIADDGCRWIFIHATASD